MKKISNEIKGCRDVCLAMKKSATMYSNKGVTQNGNITID